MPYKITHYHKIAGGAGRKAGSIGIGEHYLRPEIAAVIWSRGVAAKQGFLMYYFIGDAIGTKVSVRYRRSGYQRWSLRGVPLYQIQEASFSGTEPEEPSIIETRNLFKQSRVFLLYKPPFPLRNTILNRQRIK